MQSIISRIMRFFGGSSASSGKAGSGKGKSTSTGKTTTGKIIYFNWSKGYGFIECAEVPDRVFVHRTKLNSRVKNGEEVTFVLGKNQRGYFAEEVTSKPGRK